MAIIKYRVEATATRTNVSREGNSIASQWQYEDIRHPEKGGELLDRDEAIERIRERKMVLVFSSPFGAVYDYPDEPFWQQYQGYYSSYRKRTKL